MKIDFGAYEESDSDSECLFHYTTRKIALKYILGKGELKFSTREKAHDPLEKEKFTFTASTIASGSHEVTIQNLQQNLRHGKLINHARNLTKNACFSIDKGPLLGNPWNKGVFRSRMWSQYAESHKGVCIVFDKKCLISTVKEYQRRFKKKFLIFKKISYANSIHRLGEVSHITPELATINPIEFLRQNAKEFLFSKISDYKNEQEYRIAIYNETPSADFISVLDSIVGIVAGYYCDDVTLDKLMRFAEILGIPCVKAGWFRGRPFLEFPKNQYRF